MRLTSSNLELLRTIRQSGSMARAAVTLGLTPAAVSQQMGRLEREVGSPMVERGTRGVTLTPLGRLLAERGDRVAAELEAAVESASDFLGAHANRVRVGAFPSASAYLLPEALAALRYAHPDVELAVEELASDEGVDRVAADALDFAITASYGQKIVAPPEIRVVRLLVDPLMVVLPDDHRLATSDERRAVRLEELSGDAWACSISGRPAREQLEAAASQLGFTPRVPFQTESYDVAQALAESGVAIAFVPRLALWNSPRLRARRIQPALTRQLFGVFPASTAHVALVPQLLKIVRELCLSRRTGS